MVELALKNVNVKEKHLCLQILGGLRQCPHRRRQFWFFLLLLCVFLVCKRVKIKRHSQFMTEGICHSFLLTLKLLKLADRNDLEQLNASKSQIERAVLSKDLCPNHINNMDPVRSFMYIRNYQSEVK